MKVDVYGRVSASTNEICDLLYANPEIDPAMFEVLDPIEYNSSIDKLTAPYNKFTVSDYIETRSVADFDRSQQSKWNMPDEYKELDICEWVLDQCTKQEELQRAGQELLMFNERNLFDMLRYLKYMVDTMRKNNIVWGVGRGSSVSSYVLYKIGIHKIDSLFYDLDINEFLKGE